MENPPLIRDERCTTLICKLPVSSVFCHNSEKYEDKTSEVGFEQTSPEENMENKGDILVLLSDYI